MESLYRKYRPLTFDDVVGQDHIVRALEHAVAEDRISHAYLFCGPRGTGKTTMARILAKSLLCEHTGPAAAEAAASTAPTPAGPAPAASRLPDGTCEACRAIAEGTHPDVYELDAASRTGVDSVREEIINSVSFAPVRGRFKVYIIDEVHMLSTAAFNALLKTLEEPPEHVIFVLCTTDPQKLPETILSRCQRFDFRRISNEDIVARMRHVCEQEGFAFDAEALDIVARHARGGMRDALSTLEQLSVFGDGAVTAQDARSLLGEAPAETLSAFARGIARRDTPGLFALVREQVDAGNDVLELTRDLVAHLRDVYTASIAGARPELFDGTPDEARCYVEEAELFGSSDRLARALTVLDDAALEMRTAADPRLVLEIALTRLARPECDLTLEALSERVDELERRLADAEARLATAGEGGVGACSPTHADQDAAAAAAGGPAAASAVSRPAPTGPWDAVASAPGSPPPQAGSATSASGSPTPSSGSAAPSFAASARSEAANGGSDAPANASHTAPQDSLNGSGGRSSKNHAEPEQRGAGPGASAAAAAPGVPETPATESEAASAARAAPVRPASPAPAPVADTLPEAVPGTDRAQAAELQRRWDEVVRRTVAAQPSRGSLLQTSRAWSDDGEQLIVRFPKGSTFNLRMLGRADSTALVQPIVDEVFGPRHVRYVMDGDPVLSAPAPAPAAAAPASASAPVPAAPTSASDPTASPTAEASASGAASVHAPGARSEGSAPAAPPLRSDSPSAGSDSAPVPADPAPASVREPSPSRPDSTPASTTPASVPDFAPASPAPTSAAPASSRPAPASAASAPKPVPIPEPAFQDESSYDGSYDGAPLDDEVPYDDADAFFYEGEEDLPPFEGPYGIESSAVPRASRAVASASRSNARSASRTPPVSSSEPARAPSPSPSVNLSAESAVPAASSSAESAASAARPVPSVQPSASTGTPAPASDPAPTSRAAPAPSTVPVSRRHDPSDDVPQSPEEVRTMLGDIFGAGIIFKDVDDADAGDAGGPPD